VAVEPPRSVRERLVSWARAALAGAATGHDTATRVRVLDPDKLHLTLCFLGERPTAEVTAIGAAMHDCTRAVGELSLGAPVWLPPRRPRALAVEVHDRAGELHALHDRLLAALAVVCEAEIAQDAKRFRPHVTVARMGAGSGPAAGALPATPSLSFAPQSLVLYRSTLAPAGATYEPLTTVVLAGTDGDPA
jgi:2'-5' RNA ligase